MSLIYIIFLALCFFIALNDFLFFRIPNMLILTLIGLFVAKLVFLQTLEESYFPLIVFVVSITVGFMLYAFKFVGAGDAKFLAVTAMWASEMNLLAFFLIIGLAGGLVALLYLFMERPINAVRAYALSILPAKLQNDVGTVNANVPTGTKQGKSKKTTLQKRSIPYGVPVFIGCLILTILVKL